MKVRSVPVLVLVGNFVFAGCASTVAPTDAAVVPVDAGSMGDADAGRPHPTPCHPAGQACGADLWCCGGYCDRADGGPGACQPVPTGTFPCGTTYCQTGEYCELTYSDTTSPDRSVCRPVPDACGGMLSCACVPQDCARACSMRDGTTIVLRCPGG